MTKTVFFLFIIVSINCFSQRNPKHRNSINLQAGGDTPQIGLAYKRNIWRDSTAKHQVDVGGGIGWAPILFLFRTSTATRKYTLSHHVSYKRSLNEYFDAMLGYSGIIADKDNPFGNRMTYYPMLQIGGRAHVFHKIAFGANICMLYNENETFEVRNQNELFKEIRTYVLIYPALYLSINF